MLINNEAQIEHHKKLEHKLSKLKYAFSKQQYTECEAQENIKVLVTEDIQSVIKTLRDHFIINHPKLTPKKLHKLMFHNFENLQGNYKKIREFVSVGTMIKNLEHLFPDEFWHTLNQTVSGIFHQELKKTINEHAALIKKEKRDKRMFLITVFAILIAMLGIAASLYPTELKASIGVSLDEIELSTMTIYHDLFDTYLCKQGLLE